MKREIDREGERERVGDGEEPMVERHCMYLGMLLALALYNETVVNSSMPAGNLLKALVRDRKSRESSLTSLSSGNGRLRISSGLRDLRELDRELSSGLENLLAFEPAEEVEAVFGLTFEVDLSQICRSQGIGEVKTSVKRKNLELIEMGSQIPVTGANRREYVDRYCKWLLDDSIAVKAAQLRNGFSRVVPLRAISIFSAQQFSELLFGASELDFSLLERSASYEGWADGNCTQASRAHATVRAFWNVVHALSDEEGRRLLMFVTGSRRAPVTGMASMRLVLQRMGPDSPLLPTAHTCFNALLLPEYPDADKLRDRLLIALSDCEGFGLS